MTGEAALWPIHTPAPPPPHTIRSKAGDTRALHMQTLAATCLRKSKAHEPQQLWCVGGLEVEGRILPIPGAGVCPSPTASSWLSVRASHPA